MIGDAASRTSRENRAAGAKAKHAVEHGADAIVVCGGDGTVFDVLQGLAGSEMPLGIIPCGTGNILAQNLHILKKSADTALWLLRAKPRAVPLRKITCCVSGGTRTCFFRHSCRNGLPRSHHGSDAPLRKEPDGRPISGRASKRSSRIPYNHLK